MTSFDHINLPSHLRDQPIKQQRPFHSQEPIVQRYNNSPAPVAQVPNLAYLRATYGLDLQPQFGEICRFERRYPEIVDRVNFKLTQTVELTHDYDLDIGILDGVTVIRKSYRKLQMDPKNCLKLRQQLEVQLQVKHPNIEPILAVTETTNKLEVFTPYYRKSLKRYLQKIRLDDSAVLSIFRKILGAMTYLHDREICHRDLRPENILLDHNLSPYLTNFSMASVQTSHDRNQSVPSGTFNYIPPEILNGQYHCPYEADNWALGCLLYYLTYNRVPFPSEQIDDKNDQMHRGPIFQDDTPMVLQQTIRGLLHYRPEIRFTLLDCHTHFLNLSMSNSMRSSDTGSGDRTPRSRRSKTTSDSPKEEPKSPRPKKKGLFKRFRKADK